MRQASWRCSLYRTCQMLGNFVTDPVKADLLDEDLDV